MDPINTRPSDEGELPCKINCKGSGFSRVQATSLVLILTVAVVTIIYMNLGESHLSTGGGIHEKGPNPTVTTPITQEESTKKNGNLLHLTSNEAQHPSDPRNADQAFSSDVNSNEGINATSIHEATKNMLRHDWTYNPITSEIGKLVDRHQRNCSIPLATYRIYHAYGLGSNLHTWSSALCHAMEHNWRIETVSYDWRWLDRENCQDEMNGTSSPLLCYFPAVEQLCGGQEASTLRQRNRTAEFPRVVPSWHLSHKCPNTLRVHANISRPRTQFRTGTTDFMFQRVSPLIIEEAERQARLVFGPDGGIPDDLITIHIRWGDKEREMKPVPIKRFIGAINRIQHLRGRNNGSASIYVATEDPKALSEFKEEAPRRWRVYADQYVTDMAQHRPESGNHAVVTAKRSHGHSAVVALGSLLLSMEASDFVLTRGSNWSRLMDELRKSKLDPKCGNCTIMIDLSPGES